MVLVLTLVAVIMGGILAYVNHLTEGPINAQKEKTLADGIKTVMVCNDLVVANTDEVKQNDEKGKEITFKIYQVKDAQGQDLGAAVESTTGGFGGDLKVLVGFDPEGKILGYTLLEHQETPGLGAKADKWFQKGEKGDIIGKTPSEPLTVSKDGGQVDAITASTITSRAFLLAVNQAYNAYKATPAADAATGATQQSKPENEDNANEVKESHRKGTGAACKLRAVVEYDKKDRVFTVTQLPFMLYTNTVCKELEDIINSEENPGVERFNDLTGENVNLKIYLAKKANPDKVLKYLYKNTSLQTHYGVNFTMLENGRFPRVYGWKELLQAHIDHEKEVYKRGYEYDIRKIEDRLHILDGLLICLANIDEVVRIIKTSDSPSKARERLAAEYELDDVQTKAILDMKLSRLAHLEVEKLKSEKTKLEKEREIIYNIINNEELFNNELIKGWREVADKFGDPRRTQILNISKDDEEPTETQELLINLSNQNNIYVTTTSTLYTQRRGGVGNKFKMSKGEYVIATASGTNLDTVLLFSNQGNCYHLTASELPFEEVIPIESLIEIGTKEKIEELVFLNKKKQKEHIIFFTKKGILKKSRLSEYNIKRKVGVKALNLDNDDEIVSILFVNDERVGMMTARGQFVMCETKDVRPIGRVARGVKGITLNDGDFLVSARVVTPDTKEFLSISEKGYIKRTAAKDFVVTGRATKGSKIHALKDSDDRLIAFSPISNEQETIVVSSNAQIKINLNEINLLSKGAQGTKSMKLSNAKVIGLLVV